MNRRQPFINCPRHQQYSSEMSSRIKDVEAADTWDNNWEDDINEGDEEHGNSIPVDSAEVQRSLLLRDDDDDDEQEMEEEIRANLSSKVSSRVHAYKVAGIALLITLVSFTINTVIYP